jgi:N-acetylglutamate synthase-like GNAT family acetyltransferase
MNLPEQNVLNQFRLFLIKNKYKNVLKTLLLEHCTDDEGDYIQLNCIQIKPSLRNKGYGNLVMSDIVQYADNQNVRIRLYVTNLFGAVVERLYGFYQKHGFVLIKKDNDGHMMRYPKKHKK